MANRILTKRSGIANAVPSSSNLALGELAINYADGSLFFKDTSNNVAVIASTQFANVSGNITGGNIDTAGDITALGNISGNFIIGDGSQLTNITTPTLFFGDGGTMGQVDHPVTSNGDVGQITVAADLFQDFGNLTGNLLPIKYVAADVDLLATLDVSGNATINGTVNTTSIEATANISASFYTGTFVLSMLGFQKDSDVTGSGNVTWNTTPYLNQGASFGTMGANGTFTFNNAGVYQINVAYNVSANPDGWGGINGVTGTRYNQANWVGFAANIRSSATDVITVSANDTYTWQVNNSVTVYGTGNSKSRIQIMRIG